MVEPAKHAWQDLDTVSFGDTPEMVTALAALVLAGTKRATCWAAVHGATGQVGQRKVLLDGEGRPRAVLETTELTQRRFSEVDEAFANDEGEGDRTLRYWREEHRAFFGREGIFAPDMMLYCERFKLVQAINC